MNVNLEYARKMEGNVYGVGAADLSERVAKAAFGKRKAADQAKAVAAELRKYVDEIGGKGEREVFEFSPAQSKAQGYGDCWRVGFEGGPYEWAIVASEALGQLGIFAEPYYSFDLCFYPGEDK